MRQSILQSDYACITVNNNVTAMEIPAVNAWLKVGVFAKNKPNRVSVSDQANNRLVAGANGDYDIEMFLGLSAAGANKAFEVSVFDLNPTAKVVTGATAADPVVLTVVGHGYSDGDKVAAQDLGGMVEVNDRIYTIAGKTDDTFQLTDDNGDDVDGGGFTAYTTGGTVQLATETDVHADRSFVTATSIGSASGGSIEPLIAGCQVEMYMKNTTDATNMTSETLTLKMKRVG